MHLSNQLTDVIMHLLNQLTDGDLYSLLEYMHATRYVYKYSLFMDGDDAASRYDELARTERELTLKTYGKDVRTFWLDIARGILDEFEKSQHDIFEVMHETDPSFETIVTKETMPITYRIGRFADKRGEKHWMSLVRCIVEYKDRLGVDIENGKRWLELALPIFQDDKDMVEARLTESMKFLVGPLQEALVRYRRIFNYTLKVERVEEIGLPDITPVDEPLAEEDFQRGWESGSAEDDFHECEPQEDDFHECEPQEDEPDKDEPKKDGKKRLTIGRAWWKFDSGNKDKPKLP